MNAKQIERKALLEDYVKKGYNMSQIGNRINVTRQRVYQLFDQLNIQTPERNKHGYWKQQDDRLKWLNRTLSSKAKTISKLERGEILDMVEKDLDAFLPKFCPILGIELVYGEQGIRTDNSASVDRLDSSKPYSKENISIISWRANRIKNDGTLEEHKKLVEWWIKKCNT